MTTLRLISGGGNASPGGPPSSRAEEGEALRDMVLALREQALGLSAESPVRAAFLKTADRWHLLAEVHGVSLTDRTPR